MTSLEASPAPTDELGAGRRAIDGVSGAAVLGEWCWHGEVGRWSMPVALTADVLDGGPVPSTTLWYIVVESDYPLGAVGLYPAKDGGLAGTFPHQAHNGHGTTSLPWRAGKLCLEQPSASYSGHGPAPGECHDAHSRLAWHCARALDWLRRASRSDLTRPGDPFELPHFPSCASAGTVIFSEGPESFGEWTASREPCGLVALNACTQATGICAATRFTTADGRDVRLVPWGDAIGGPERLGVWLRLDRPPVTGEWECPSTWGELLSCIRNGVRRATRLIRGLADRIRDGEPHYLLLGFPIPSAHGREAEQMHWQGLRLPVLAHGPVDGFRSPWHHDVRVALAASAPVCWCESQNWSPERLFARGAIPADVQSAQVLLVGAGALGGPVAEMLVRGGLRKIAIIDGDRVSAGNLARHVLALGDVGSNKAEALAERLRSISPHVRATALPQYVTPSNPQHTHTIQQADIVIDCTASDSALACLARCEAKAETLWVSLSVGRAASRAYCFASRGTCFPVDAFRAVSDAQLAAAAADGSCEIWEGPGCWHPTFPARADDMLLAAAAATKFVVEAASSTTSAWATYESRSCPTGLCAFERVGGASHG